MTVLLFAQTILLWGMVLLIRVRLTQVENQADRLQHELNLWNTQCLTIEELEQCPCGCDLPMSHPDYAKTHNA